MGVDTEKFGQRVKQVLVWCGERRPTHLNHDIKSPADWDRMLDMIEQAMYAKDQEIGMLNLEIAKLTPPSDIVNQQGQVIVKMSGDCDFSQPISEQLPPTAKQLRDMAAKQRAELDDLDEYNPDYYACFTGDCPHDKASDCLLSVQAEAEATFKALRQERHQVEVYREQMAKAEAVIEQAMEILKTIVCTMPPDDGVVLLSDDGPCHYDRERNCQVYDHEHFSPLGDALMNLYGVLNIKEKPHE